MTALGGVSYGQFDEHWVDCLCARKGWAAERVGMLVHVQKEFWDVAWLGTWA